jgi:hypothetical protein
MPSGIDTPVAVKKEIMQKLRDGWLPKFLAQEYGLSPWTIRNWEAVARKRRRAEMTAQSLPMSEIEQRINQEFRGDNVQVRSFEYRGAFKKEYLL